MDQSWASTTHREREKITLICRSEMSVLLEGIHSQDQVTGLTHNFYKYPARFSPKFTRSVIRTFTEPGEVVFDPFLGGGTTAVEARSLGRRVLGTDISSLAVFLSEVKSCVLEDRHLKGIRTWVEGVAPKLNIWRPAQRASAWADMGYQRNINSKETWRIRKLIELVLAESSSLRTMEEKQFARCIALRTGQWALDCRRRIPPVKDFRKQFEIHAAEMLRGAAMYGRAVRNARPVGTEISNQGQSLYLHRSVVGVENEVRLGAYMPIKLVLTSPPYPGVHVLYHRWQVQGRRETAAPFWITSCLDGQGASHYTFGDRNAYGLHNYFEQALAAFRSLSRVIERETLVVQMVAFSEPEWQLKQYMGMMCEAGFAEIKLPELANSPDGRVWRAVPNRKWYASQRGATPSSSEVVLFHRLRPGRTGP